MRNIFISTPMSAISTKSYGDFRTHVLQLIEHLRSQLASVHIHYSGAKIADHQQFEGPAYSYRHDVNALNEAELFILIYPERSPTSALIELGYALRMNIPILLMAPSRADLPYMVQELDQVLDNGFVFEYQKLDLMSFIREDKRFMKTLKILTNS